MPLSRIAGHAPAVALLRQAVARRRVPQSLLLAGPEGVGKRAVAIALAQAVNCPRRGERGDDACGECPTCLRIARGQHADVALLDKGDEASIKIKPVRERILDVIGYRPFEAQRRVFIIDGADWLTDEAQDALLKTLEEPPASAMLILVTAYPDTLKPTILSRCRRLRFGPLAEADVARVLVASGTDAKKARALAATSGGSVSQAIAEAAGEVGDDRDAALALLTAGARGPVAGRLKAATAFAQNESNRRDREALAARLAVLGSLLRDLTALAAGTRDEGVLANADLAGPLKSLSGTYQLIRAVEAFGTVNQAAHALVERNASPKIIADWVALSV